jgi:uncharacterized protein (UPF0276 family)
VKFAINYSPQAEQLLRDRKIEIDRFKCADWPDMIAAARASRPVYVHFPLDAGSISGRDSDLETVAAMCDDTDTPYVNMHLVAYARDFPGTPPETMDESVTEIVLRRMIDDVKRVAAQFGVERVIVENIPYFGAAARERERYMRASVDADVILRVVDETGCGFLLDVSHARIAAHHLGVEPRAYIESLPVARLRELHVTGIETKDGRMTDHMGLADEDWRWAQWALDNIRQRAWATPWIVALEYGGIGEAFRWRSEASVIASNVPRLYEMAHASL